MKIVSENDNRWGEAFGIRQRASAAKQVVSSRLGEIRRN